MPGTDDEEEKRPADKMIVTIKKKMKSYSAPRHQCQTNSVMMPFIGRIYLDDGKNAKMCLYVMQGRGLLN